MCCVSDAHRAGARDHDAGAGAGRGHDDVDVDGYAAGDEGKERD